MFRQFTASNPTQANALFTQHPLQIAALIERAWKGRVVPPPGSAPFPANPFVDFPTNPFTEGVPISLPFEHLIYAYMAENTRIYDIFRRVVLEYVQGEKLEIPSFDGQRWLRTTEELFFRDPPSFLSFTLTSQLRPDANATRRNAYYRMFGLDLNHGTEDNKPYPYTKPTAANREFISTLELLLTEVWRGITNSKNTSGAKDTDNDAIATLALRLRDMLTVRRQNGNLSREEFWFTAMIAWFHLTVEYNSPIVVDLRADATSPEDRLKKIGERIGLPSHAKSQAFFLLADAMSLFLRQIEAGSYTNSTTAQLLYNPPVQDNMIQIITQYSVATGRDIKARTVVLQKR
jgi:hypothetical protein